jgi:hypothetical protein
MADDLVSALRSLANRWVLKARDFARSAKDDGVSETQASYDKGFADGYYRAATELAAVIKEFETGAPPPAPQTRPPAAPQQRPPAAGASQQRPAPPAQRPSPPVQQRPPAPPPPAPPSAPTYLSVTVGEALSVLEFAGTHVRDIQQNKDNTFRAVFSSWENMMPNERLERIQKADARIVIIKSGKMETHDQFIEFAFKGN